MAADAAVTLNPPSVQVSRRRTPGKAIRIWSGFPRVVILLAVAVPNLMTARANAAETVVIREIQTIHQAQIQYLSQFGKFASTLAEEGRCEWPNLQRSGHGLAISIGPH
jgi:hypothetical protein